MDQGGVELVGQGGQLWTWVRVQKDVLDHRLQCMQNFKLHFPKNNNNNNNTRPGHTHKYWSHVHRTLMTLTKMM